MKRLILTVIFFGFAPVALAFNASEHISLENFQLLVTRHERQMLVPSRLLDKIHEGDRLFVPIGWLRPGQARYSFDLSVEKINKYASAKDLFHPVDWESLLIHEHFKEALAYDDGKSLLPMRDRVSVALTDEGLILVDGTHHDMASLAVNAETIPIQAVANLRGFHGPELQAELLRLGLIYPIDLIGRPFYASRFSQLQNDPNRYAMSLVTLKVKVDRNGMIMERRSAVNHPVVVKVEPGVRFFQEMQGADILNERNLIYDAHKYGNQIPGEFRERLREALVTDQKNGGARTQHMLLLSPPLQWMVRDWLDEHVVGSSASCRIFADPPAREKKP